MKVREVNLGGGLFRLVFEPTCGCERNMPSNVLDNIAKDVINRRNNPWGTRGMTAPQHTMPTPPRPTREPDGIDIHVDRPLRENFRSHIAWCDAMAKYRTLEHIAKDCDWECREPMATLPNYKNISAPRCVEPCWCDDCDEDWNGVPTTDWDLWEDENDWWF